MAASEARVWQVKRVLVTGATGFSGQYLCEALAAKSYQVTGTFLKPPSKRPAHTQLFSIDLKSTTAVVKLIRSLKPHYLFHLAAQSSAQRSWQDQEETFTVNAGATLNLLNAMRSFSPNTRMLYISSVQVYGRSFHGDATISEQERAWPENPYASSKRVAELACLDFYQRYNLDIVIARVVNHTGPGQESQFVFSDWCRQIALAEKKKRPGSLQVGNLNVKRDFLNVKDVVRAYLQLMAKGKAGEIYNVASSRPISLKKYAEFLSQRAKVKFKIVTQKHRVRSLEPLQMRIDSSKMKALGWKPRFTTFQALEDLLEDWRKVGKK